MYQLTFGPLRTNASAVAKRDGKPVLRCSFADGCFDCELLFDFDERPLCLCAEACVGDQVTLVVLPQRIELWVGETLADEEWQAGACLFFPDIPIRSDMQIEITPYAQTQQNAPSVLGTFRNADGWRPDKNVFVGDCMPYTHDGRYHVLYLKDRHHHMSKWGFGAHQWEHISTRNFVDWDIHPMAVEITAPYEGSICTGSWIERNGKQYLFYTVRMADRSPAPILRSVSEDGYHFEKDGSFGFTLPARYDGRNARDPKVILGDDGLYHMFLTTALAHEQKGCLAHFVSNDLTEWNDIGTPIYTGEDETHPECPDYFRYGDWYYLVFSLHGKAHYRYSRTPFDGWKTPKDPIIPCHNVPKAALWNGKVVFTGYRMLKERCYAGTMCFVTATADADGELRFDTTPCLG